MKDSYDKYDTIIGLEVHVQLNTCSKIFCSDVNEFDSEPNTNISAISLGHPGTLPKLNKAVINSAIKLGLATNCEITRFNHFDRKNYFYVDLPKGYQITQDKNPICKFGFVVIHDNNNHSKKIGINRIHMEEDAGKSIHDSHPESTLVNLNRAGVPLLEIVTDPVIVSADEAYNFLVEIRKLVRYIDICDGNMEEGSMRCDANISVKLRGASILGTRVEVKNMNSMRNVQRAIQHEEKRQIDLIESGGKIIQETRSYDALNDTTFLLRSKEMANDYRYFPEPDIQPYLITTIQITDLKSSLPTLPIEFYEKYTIQYNLSHYDASFLTESKEIAFYYEQLAKHISNKKVGVNWLMGLNNVGVAYLVSQ